MPLPDSNLPWCSDITCFANKNCICQALSNNDFKGKPCVFYKEKRAYQKELMLLENKLKNFF